MSFVLFGLFCFVSFCFVIPENDPYDALTIVTYGERNWGSSRTIFFSPFDIF